MNDQEKIRSLETEYRAVIGLAEAFCDELAKQLAKLIDRETIPLGFPIQRRVKKWESLAEKLDRVALSIDHVKDVQDLIGLRVILLFRRDVDRVDRLLRNTLKVSRAYDTGERLQADQFGYSSRHYITALPEGWLGVPTFDGMGDFTLVPIRV
jgi:putative GTP pyrophosphokinase